MSWGVAIAEETPCLRVGLVGAGAHGARHASKIASLPGARLVAVLDPLRERAEAVALAHGAAVLPDLDALAERVEAAVLATPASTHARLAGELLGNGLHVLVEKPLSLTAAEAEALCAKAEASDLVLRVGHLERFNPAFLELARALRAPRWLRLERLGPNPGRGLDADVVREVMIHDLDLLAALGLPPPDEVMAQGAPVFSGQVDVCSARLRWANGLVAEVLASRAHGRVSRRLEALDAGGFWEVDLAARSVACTRAGLTATQPRILDAEPDALLEQDRAFVQAALQHPDPGGGASGRDGARAVSLAERILGCLASAEVAL